MAKIKNRIVGSGEEPLDGILFNPRNWRIHPLNQQNALKGVLEEVGWVQQVIVNKRTGNLVDGHLRCQLAAREGATTIPVVYIDVSEEEELLVLSTLDPIAAMAATDKHKLDELFADIESENENVKKMLDEIAEKEKLDYGKKPVEDVEPQIDKAEELRVKWGVETGQLWKLGEHRLICGDCTDKDVIDKMMRGDIASITFTSPPYNAGVSAKLRGNTSIDDNLYKDEYDDNKSQKEYLDLLSDFTSWAFTVSEYVFVNLQVLAGNKLAFIDYLNCFRSQFADVAIWDKQHAAPELAQRVMDSRFEFILIFSVHATRAIGSRMFRGMVHNVYTGSPQRHNKYAESHAATFPVDLPEYFISNFTNSSEMVYEPFLGTGTTLIACERLGRKCRAIEISAPYCAVAIQRWVDVTGGVPELLE